MGCHRRYRNHPPLHELLYGREQQDQTIGYGIADGPNSVWAIAASPSVELLELIRLLLD